MKRLWLRLTAAFVLVIRVGVGTVALLAGWNASEQFHQYAALRGHMTIGRSG